MAAPVASPISCPARITLPNPSDSQQWQVVLRTADSKVVLWDGNALRVQPGELWDEASVDDEDLEGLEVISGSDQDQEHSRTPTPPLSVCPLCLQPVPQQSSNSSSRSRARAIPKDASYFTLLSRTNSQANTPRGTPRTTPRGTPRNTSTSNSSNTSVGEDDAASPDDREALNSGYFARFFHTVQKLGKGGSGAVYLVQHVLNGEKLGMYACKKVAVGRSAPTRLHQLLREVHVLEALQHPNVVAYHHAWVESSRLTAFGPSVDTLHILMAYANGGSLDAFIAQRGGGTSAPSSPEERVRRFRMRNLGAVHLLRLDEILAIFEDVCEGLAFLHSRSILHLDLKAENVLLHWDEDALLPCAKISDFGSADSTTEAWQRERTGSSGTLDWTPPEAWDRDPKTSRLRTPDRATDQWALGLILHLLSFFTLPYHNDEDLPALEQEIRAYRGFFAADALSLDHGIRHDLPSGLLRIMTRLIHWNPAQRPSCTKVLVALRKVREEALQPPASQATNTTALVTQRSPSPAGLPLLSVPPVLTVPPPRQLSLPLPDKMPLVARAVLPQPREPQYRLAGLAAVTLLKVASLQRLCGSRPLSNFAVYAVLVPALLDVAVLDYRLSLGLLVLQLVGLVWMGFEEVCFV